MPEEWQFFLEKACVFAFAMSISGSADQLFFSRQIGIDPITGLVRLQYLQNLGPIWVRYAGSKNSLEDQERAVSTVEIQ